MQIKAIVFDLGGVLFTEGKKVAAEKLHKVFGYDKDIVINSLKNPKSLELRAGEIDDKTFWNYLQTILPKGYDAQIIKEYWYNGYQLDKNILKLINKLYKKYELIIFSGNIKSRVEYLDEKYNYRKYFSKEIFSYEYHLNKPDKRFLNVLIDKSGFAPQEMIYIDDDPKMLQPAKNSGINVIHYKTGEIINLTKELERFEVVI